MHITPSEQQKAIFAWFAKDKAFFESYDIHIDADGNLVVRARAGTGKTWTIILGINVAPEQNIMLCAFNKRIAEELQVRITNPRAQAKTLHALGYACVRRYRSNLRIASGSTRADKLSELACGATAPDAIKRLVSKLHTKGREMVPHATEFEQLVDIAVNFECEPDEEWFGTQYDTQYVVEKALKAMQIASEVQSGEEIDFADMIFLPVRNHWLTKQYDLVVVDEAQDMTKAQLEIARGICKGRLCIVGDDRQAIYAFRGADSGSIDRLKAELQAGELGLTTTYRCGQVITDRARELVSDIQCGPSNPIGEILDLPGDKLVECCAPGDFVVSRINAPLVSTAISLLRAGKRTRIAGRDIGAGLVRLVRKLAKGKASGSVPDFIERVQVWRDREVARLMAAKHEGRCEAINDQADMLVELADDVNAVQEIIVRIESLFTDDGLGQQGVITCSSVHRVKGLEARRVFVLWDTMKRHNQEEFNIQYVAITRAKESLVLVRG